MPSNRRKLRRPFIERRYRKLFIISVEGVKTEPQYFSILNGQNSVIKVSSRWIGLPKLFAGARFAIFPHVLTGRAHLVKQRSINWSKTSSTLKLHIKLKTGSSNQFFNEQTHLPRKANKKNVRLF
jgi:hypothetical protein